MDKLTFYFDYVSPYSYLAWTRLPELCSEHELTLEPRPVLFAGLLGHWGQLGPAEIPPKRRWVVKDVLRYAARCDVTIRYPELHPFNPLAALRVSLPEVCGASRQREVVDAIFRAVWKEGRDVSDNAVLEDVLSEVFEDPAARLAETGQTSIKQLLKERTSEAAEREVFGVPTIVVGDELFWGNDRLWMVERYLEGRDDYDRRAAREAIGGIGGSAGE